MKRDIVPYLTGEEIALIYRGEEIPHAAVLEYRGTNEMLLAGFHISTNKIVCGFESKDFFSFEDWKGSCRMYRQISLSLYLQFLRAGQEYKQKYEQTKNE